MAYVNSSIYSRESMENLGLKAKDIISFNRTINRINNCFEKQEKEAARIASEKDILDQISDVADEIRKKKEEIEIEPEMEDFEM